MRRGRSCRHSSRTASLATASPLLPVGLLGDSRGAKTAAIERFVRERIADEFTIADVRDASLGASDSLIGKVLARLRDEGVIEPLGTGRSAKWRRRGEPSQQTSFAEHLERFPAELTDPFA